ncbi:hypothetical protein EDB89DRAFT_348452 [Lactarius sanguifluus]|nr:hypothetical protein EDB89DRAFT_348452 [Lactarius sanguifluus]
MSTTITKENLPPTPTRDDNLLNPSFHHSPPPPPPPLPPKSLSPALPDTPPDSGGLRPLLVDDTASNQDLNTLPGTPPSPDARTKRPNLLVDLIETEKLYVDQMAGVIRKVASAWSRTNLPPHELDLMFRSIEGVYKADRSLLSRLKEIGTSPSSPKALGDLLMRWIGDLEMPYTMYCERYCSGFDAWEHVRDNTRLPDVLATFSATLPPPNASSSSPAPPVWTLDELFLLPKGRLKYFKKLYGRLLKGTQPGRSDYKLLAGAAETLDKLLGILDARASVKAGSSTPTAPETEDEVVVDFRKPAVAQKTLELPPTETTTGSETSSARESSQSSAARSSNDTSLSSIDQGATGELGIPLLELEGHLSAERCLDIFTMMPRKVRLQILPPTLPYVRTMRVGVGTGIRIVPRSTGVEVNHPKGRVFILSDLFLLCEQIAPGETSTENPGADTWLLYPPLAGKHLKVEKVVDDDRALQVTVLRKEKVVLLFASAAMRDRVLFELQECIEFASAVHAASKHPLPPLPTLNGVPKPHGDGIPSSHTAPDLHRPNVPPKSSRSPSPHRVSSPIGSLNGSASRRGSGPPSRNSHDTTAMSPMSLTSSMSNLVSSLEAQIQQGGSWAPPAPAYDARSSPTYPVRQPSQREIMDNSAVGQPRLVGGLPPRPAPNLRGRSPPPVAPIPKAGLAPGQIVSPGQFLPPQFPPQRAASAEPLGRRGPPQVPANPGMDPSFAPRGPPGAPRPPPIPVNGQFAPPSPPYGFPPGRTPSDPSFQGGIRKSPSEFPLTSPSEPGRSPQFDGSLRPGMASSPNLQLPRTNSLGTMGGPQQGLRPVPPSVQFRAPSMVGPSPDELSPPTSPTMDIPPVPTGPVTSSVSAQMKCKVFLKQGHAQWKSLGSARLKLYHQQPTNVKQLVVEAEDKNKSVLISTIVLSDGVERVGKTGVAVELSDNGARTGIVYMIQLRNEQAAVGLFGGLLEGSDRTRR